MRNHSDGPTVLLKSTCGSKVHLVWFMQFHVSSDTKCMYLMILRSDDSLQVLICYEMFQGSVLFLAGVLEQSRQAEEQGRLQSRGMCEKCCILEQPKQLHFRTAQICSYLLLFSLISFSMKRSNRSWPQQDAYELKQGPGLATPCQAQRLRSFEALCERNGSWSSP